MQKIVYDILSYLVENPDAQDTLEGIVGWWLSQQTVNLNTAFVEEALTILVNRKLVLARRGKDTQTYYKVNRRKLREISAMLTQPRDIDAPED